jgi:formylmethanofuran dehydrogenase subunit E
MDCLPPESGTEFDALIEQVTRFHSYPAPGVLIGVFMVQAAQRTLPGECLYQAICETSWCLPDAIQMLTPCTIGNGRLHIVDQGLFALSLYDKTSGEGTRIYLDAAKLASWPEITAWFLKLTPKRQQRSDLLREEIRRAGDRVCSRQTITAAPHFLIKRSKGPIQLCPTCHEAYPVKTGRVCRRCQGDSPYVQPAPPPGAGASPPAPATPNPD